MPTRPPTLSLNPTGGKRPPDQRKAKQFYDSAAWHRLKAVVKAEQPLCADCPPDRPELATQVHHVQELLLRWDLRLVRENLVGLCDECHARRHKGVRSWQANP